MKRPATPSAASDGREAWGDHTKPLPMLCSKEKKAGWWGEGHPHRPDTPGLSQATSRLPPALPALTR